MIPVLNSLLQKAINQYLDFDPEIRAGLKPLSGKIIKINITLIQIEILIKIENESLMLLNHDEEHLDGTISGPPSAFFRLWLNSDTKATAIPKDLVLTGNTQLIQKINDVFTHIEIDWEEILSKFMGDFLAHQIGNLERKIKNWFLETKEVARQNLSEYLQEELTLLPSSMEMEDFLSDVDELRDRVARLETLVNQYS